MSEHRTPEPADPEPHMDPSTGRGPTAHGGLADSAATDGTSKIFTGGVGERSPDSEADKSPIDQIVEGGARSGWGRGRDIEPGDSIPKPGDG